MTPDEIEFLYPVTSVIVHRGGHLTVKRSPRFAPKSEPPENNGKAKIVKLSLKSIRRLNHIMQCTKVDFNAMVTVTYPQFYPKNGKEVKEDLQHILNYFARQKWYKNYLWFLEFQTRGAPHFHIMLEMTKPPTITPEMRVKFATSWLKRVTKQEWFYAECPVGEFAMHCGRIIAVNAHYKTWELIKEPAGAARYVAKYAAKAKQKEVPEDYQDVGRFWGCSQAVKDIEGVSVDITLDELIKVLKDNGHKAASWDYMPKHIWGVTSTRG